MEKKFRLEGLTCPNCSAKIERAVADLEGVEDSSINLMQQVLTVRLAGAAEPNWLNKINAVVHTYEPEVRVEELAGPQPKREADDTLKEARWHLFKLGTGAILYAIGLFCAWGVGLEGLNLGILVASYLILGGDVLYRAVRNVGKGQIFDENFLMSVSTLGAFGIGEYPEAVAVMLFYQIGEFFQDLAVRRSRQSIADLMDVRPDVAFVRRAGTFQAVAPETVEVGEIIQVKPGGKVPLDGTVLEGSSSLDTSCLTGESIPRSVQTGDAVWAGCVNQQGQLVIQVEKVFGESTAAKMIDLVEHAASRKAPAEHFITTFSRYYTPVVVGAAVGLAVLVPWFTHADFATWLHRGLVFLVISCPCALVLSVPLTFFGGIGAASRKGILVKGGNYLEALTKVEYVAFDKTGTLTQGIFQVNEVLAEPGFTPDEVVEWAAYAEGFSNHPIARSIREAYAKEIDESTLKDYQELAGGGIRALVRGRAVVVGNVEFLTSQGISCEETPGIGTQVHVAVDGKLAGTILIADEVKPDSQEAVRGLKRLGVKQCILLTGDHETAARKAAEQVGVDAYYASLLPQEKVQKVEEWAQKKRPGKKLLFVGDGINDAPVLARSDIGVAMGGLGSDAAAAAADVVLMTDEPSKLVTAIQVAKKTKGIVMQNIVLALGIKTIFLLLGTWGLVGLWEAVFADVGVMLLAVLNATRVMRDRW